MRFASSVLRSKLGCRWTPGTLPTVTSGAVAAIDNGHSILLEAFLKWNSRYVPVIQEDILMLRDAGGVGNNIFIMYYQRPVNDIAFALKDAGGWDLATDMPTPPENAGIKYIAMLLDRTNNRKIIYDNGQITANDAIGAINPDFSAGNSRIQLLNTRGTIDIVHILFRITTLTSVPASINSDIKWMYQFPMHGLAQGIQTNLGAIASEWSFEDQILNSTTILDNGVTGGYPLTSTVNLQTLMKIVEKP